MLIPNVLPISKSFGDAAEAGQTVIYDSDDFGADVATGALAANGAANHLAIENERFGWPGDQGSASLRRVETSREHPKVAEDARIVAKRFVLLNDFGSGSGRS